MDHYISQVHLRKFCSPVLGDRMFALRKSDLKGFTPNSRSICRIEDGSTNSYLIHDREIEEFLRDIEPAYDAALESLRQGAITRETVYTVAGFLAYVLTCSPTAMRMNLEPLKRGVEEAAFAIDAAGEFPPPPTDLGGSSLAELLTAGTVRVEIDGKYPQALGIAAIRQHTARLGCSRWEILHNRCSDSPFFTSDYPAAIELAPDPRVVRRVLPLAPDLAIRVTPDADLDHASCTLDFDHFSFRERRVSRHEVVAINRLLVRCAEDLVIYRDDHPWVYPFVARNRHFRVDTTTQVISKPAGGKRLWFSQRIVESPKP
ncbi:MAG: DUF4238 domain-containing protein [Gammaproteobacteria bacterium]|nr:DUF4238 domain-containing protein [Gammaproteobacteria bacterium]